MFNGGPNSMSNLSVFRTKYRISNNIHFIKSIITNNEPWVYGYYLETKVQYSQLKILKFTSSKKMSDHT